MDMRFPLLIFIACLALTSAAFSQTAGSDSGQFKTVNKPDPTFPPDAKNYIYGDMVRIEIEVNKEGKVTFTKPIGPLTPCSNRGDKVVNEIQNAAVDAAKATVFEPILKNGKPEKIRLHLSYPLRPKVEPLPEEERLIIQAGDLKGKPKHLPRPEWPRANRVGGSVQLAVLIGENGRVLSFSVISGHPSLAPGTFNSICGAEFEPAQLEGKPAKVLGTMTYHFVL